MCFVPQRRALFQHPNLQKWREHVVFCTFWLQNVLRATTACTFSTSQLPKVVRRWCALYILTSKCASHHNGVHFFDISTSKSRPTLRCFAHFDFEMCFAPQRRALFRHLNFQKWSEAGVFCTFWLQNVLRATTACTFSTSQLPKVVRAWCVLYILTSKCASRHNGVQIFISHLASWLRTRRFSEPTFRPSGATSHWKNAVFRDFPTFSRICIFFLLTLSLLIFSLLIFLFSLPLPCSAFHLSILSEVWLLNFLREWITEGSLEVKLPTIWTDESRGGKSQRRERVRRKKMQVCEKVEKSRKTAFFQWLVAPEARKVGSLKRLVRSHVARKEMKSSTPLWREAHSEVKMTKAHPSRATLEVEMSKKCTPLWREAHLEVKGVKNWRVQSTFGSWDVEKVHAVVARSTFPSQNVQNTPGSEHFWKLRCWKSARRCGAKHSSKSEVQKT